MDEGSFEPDILEQERRPRLPRVPSPGWRPSQGAIIMMAVTLAAGLAVGYAVGYGQGRGTAAAPGKPTVSAGQAPRGGASESIGAVAPSAPVGFLGPALTQDLGTCSVQAGRDLELGIPVTNQSAGTVQLESARPVLPLSGLLKVLSWHWGPCGFGDDGIIPDTVALAPGATTWVTAVVQPLIACPAPAPLQFHVTYSLNSHKGASNLPGFPDLGTVHYGGCPAPAA